MHRLTLTGDAHHLGAGLRFEARRDHQRVRETGHRQRGKDLAQPIALDAARLDTANRQPKPLLVNLIQLLTEEAQVALFFPKGHQRVAGQVGNRGVNRLALGGRIHGGVHQTGDILRRHRQTGENLEYRDGLGDALMDERVGEAILRPLDRVMQRRGSAANVLLQRIVERHRRGEPADGLVGDRVAARWPLNENVLNDLNRRTQAHAAG